ncbi:MAG: hypothetical protein N3F06_01210, partial [Nitrososphaerales archaeon]|nr:hypothetical protein [Nitrososphaerales archaeon]
MEFLEWIKLPQDLQHRFFELADEESKRVGESIQKLNKEYEKLQFLQSYIDKLPNVESVSRIAAIDSSK